MQNVLTFRPAVPECEGITPRPKYSFDISQPDPRGFVLLDACVPMTLALDFMKLIALYADD